jgi:gamma-glutamyltranspeptidase/glutathione hydrolase
VFIDPFDCLRNPVLAQTYRLISNDFGDDVFYRGEVAQRLAEFYAESGVPLTLEDLRTHTSTWVQPMSVNYR